MNSFSPISQFRSKVQWYLDGNTPSFSSELAAELLVAVKLLSKDLSGFSQNAAVAFNEWSQSQTIRNIQDEASLSTLTEKLKGLQADQSLNISSKRSFRNAVVQLILIAEYSADLNFRKRVLELAQSVK